MSFLFGQPKLNRDELPMCLNWLKKEYILTVTQDQEAQEYNNSLLADGENIQKSDASAKRVAAACDRLVRAAEFVEAEHAKIAPVPEVAASDHFAWGLLFMKWKELSIAQRSAIQAVTKRSTYNEGYLQSIYQELNTLRQRAENETQKLLKIFQRSGITLTDIQNTLNEAKKVAPKFG
ncbi:MAG: hypothetical protein Q8O43_04760 [Dehalococcoidia bacterium]|nr:hypothetical protein [Dehalococcoidia bacterium]